MTTLADFAANTVIAEALTNPGRVSVATVSTCDGVASALCLAERSGITTRVNPPVVACFGHSDYRKIDRVIEKIASLGMDE